MLILLGIGSIVAFGWLRGVDLNPSYLLILFKLLIIRGPYCPVSPLSPVRQYTDSTSYFAFL
jgi:hypothetical protein